MFDTAYKEESDNAYCTEGYDLYNVKGDFCRYLMSNKYGDEIIVPSASSPILSALVGTKVVAHTQYATHTVRKRLQVILNIVE